MSTVDMPFGSVELVDAEFERHVICVIDGYFSEANAQLVGEHSKKPVEEFVEKLCMDPRLEATIGMSSANVKRFFMTHMHLWVLSTSSDGKSGQQEVYIHQVPLSMRNALVTLLTNVQRKTKVGRFVLLSEMDKILSCTFHRLRQAIGPDLKSVETFFKCYPYMFSCDKEQLRSVAEVRNGIILPPKILHCESQINSLAVDIVLNWTEPVKANACVNSKPPTVAVTPATPSTTSASAAPATKIADFPKADKIVEASAAEDILEGVGIMTKLNKTAGFLRHEKSGDDVYVPSAAVLCDDGEPDMKRFFALGDRVTFVATVSDQFKNGLCKNKWRAISVKRLLSLQHLTSNNVVQQSYTSPAVPIPKPDNSTSDDSLILKPNLNSKVLREFALKHMLNRPKPIKCDKGCQTDVDDHELLLRLLGRAPHLLELVRLVREEVRLDKNE